MEIASPFSNIAYTSQDYFDLEVERVFARIWVAVGFASSLSTPGDAQPLRIFGFPLLLLRDEKGALRVFHNSEPRNAPLRAHARVCPRMRL